MNWYIQAALASIEKLEAGVGIREPILRLFPAPLQAPSKVNESILGLFSLPLLQVSQRRILRAPSKVEWESILRLDSHPLLQVSQSSDTSRLLQR